MSVNCGGVGAATVVRWQNDTDAETYKIIILTAAAAGTSASANYYGREVINEEDQQATITAMVKDAAGDPVSDGTEVLFALTGRSNGAALSAESASTSGGEASVTLTAGGVAEFGVRVIAGGYYALAEISVVDTPIDSDGEAVTTEGNITSGTSDPWSWEGLEEGEYRKGDQICKRLPKDGDEVSGSITGQRELVGCEGEPLAYASVEMCGEVFIANAKGVFYFSCGTEGNNEITVNGIATSFTIAPADSESRWDGAVGSSRTYEVCHDATN